MVTYDEHGGFFDHVLPLKTPDDALASDGVRGFDPLGFRVPALVIGPYVEQGHMTAVQYDHTSALGHLQNTFAPPPLTARVEAANDSTDCIDLGRLARGEWARPIELPAIDVDAWPWDAPGCHGGPSFRRGPLHTRLDENPGKWDPQYDLRRTDAQATIRRFLREHMR